MSALCWEIVRTDVRAPSFGTPISQKLLRQKGSSSKVCHGVDLFRAWTDESNDSEHDFFEAQPDKNAAVYLLRMILHDWADVNCIKILKAIRASAGPSSKLLLVEDLRPYACVDTTAAMEIPGGVAPVPPPPLLPNWGHASLFGYLADLEVFTNFPISPLLEAFLANHYKYRCWYS